MWKARPSFCSLADHRWFPKHCSTKRFFKMKKPYLKKTHNFSFRRGNRVKCGYIWDFRSSGMFCNVDCWLVIDVSRHPNGPIFKYIERLTLGFDVIMGRIGCPETSITKYIATQFNIQEERKSTSISFTWRRKPYVWLWQRFSQK